VKDEKTPRKGSKNLTQALSGGSPTARSRAAIVLEVLGGARNPASAAQALGVTVGAYYGIEARAIAGLVGACDVVRRGRAVAAEDEAGRLRRELDRVKRDRDRYEALLRASHRVVGVPPPPTPKGPEKGKRRRGPSIRALAAAQALQAPADRVASVLADQERPHADAPQGEGDGGGAGTT